MLVWYDLDAKIVLHDTPEARGARKSLEDVLGHYDIEVTEEALPDGQVDFSLSGGDRMPATTVTAIDEAITALGDFVVRPVKIRAILDDEAASYWIGPKAEIEAADREERVQEAKKAIEGLTPQELFEVVRGRDIVVPLEDQSEEDDRSTATVLVNLCQSVVNVQSHSAAGEENGCVAVEVWEQELRAYLWDEHHDGDDPLEVVIQNNIVKAFGRSAADPVAEEAD